MSHLFVSATILFYVAAYSQQRGENYNPISVRAQWEYSVEFYSADVGSQKGKAITTVEGMEEINGKKYFKEVTRYIGINGLPPQVSFSRIASNGTYTIEKTENKEFLSFPFPIAIGSTWTVRNPDGEIEYRAEGTETLELYRQKYNDCLRISFHGKIKTGSIDGLQYYARNVGCVRTFVKTGVLRMEILLEKYQK